MANNFNRDLYKILNVPYDASAAEIKAAYRALARIYHPDTAGGKGDDTKFKEINEAYEILSKPAERQKYDIIHGYYTEKFKKEEELKREEAKKKFTEKIKKEQEEQKQEQQRKKKKEQRESFSKTINEALDNLFHTQEKEEEKTAEKAGKIKNEPRRPKIDGADINTEVTITLMEALRGTSRKVNILHTEPCPACAGRKIINGAECSMCNGTGQMQQQSGTEIKIPAGIKPCAKMRLKKCGEKGQNGGKDGDLYIKINIEKDKYLNSDDLDIFLTLPVSVSEAALGADILVELVKENVTVKIPPNTSSGQKLRLSGMGLENKTKTKRGDCIITIVIKIPESFSKEEKLVYERLKRISDFEPRKDFKYAK